MTAGKHAMSARRSNHQDAGGVRGPFAGSRAWAGVAAICAGLLTLALAPAAGAATPAVMVDRELGVEPVRVTTLVDDRITYFDAERRLQRASVERFVQLRGIGVSAPRRVASAAVPPAEGAVLVLTDGQRIAGRWAGAVDAADAGEAEPGEMLAWRHPTVGTVTVPLDRVRGWGAAEPVTAASAEAERDGPPTQDRAVLTNGDVIGGFVVAVTEAGVSIQPDGADEPIDLAAERVAKVMLANPDAPRDREHHTLVLHDGSALEVSGLTLRRETFSFRSVLAESEADHELEAARVARVDFTGTGRRLVPLIGQPRQVSGGEVFGVTMRPWIENGTLRLHAPVRVTFDLPSGATRVAGIAELATGPDAPPELLDWANFELRIDVGDDQPVRHHLHGENPAAALNLPISGRHLEIELIDGPNGPVLDRMRLRHAVVLIESEQARATSRGAGLQ